MVLKGRSDVWRYAPMCELGGDISYDYSGNGRNGNGISSLSKIGGKNGKPIASFISANSNWVHFGNTIGCDDNPKTIIFWANISNWPCTFLSQDNSTGNSQFYFRAEGDSPNTNINFTYVSTTGYWENKFYITQSLIQNKWNMYSAVFTGSAFLTYINGYLMLNNTSKVVNTYPFGNGSTNYGRNNTGNGYVNGYMHGLYIYSRALSKPEIISIMRDTMR